MSPETIIAADQDEHRDLIDAVDKRVDDTNSRISDIQYVLTVFGVLIGIATAVAGVVTYFSAAQKARDAASETARDVAGTTTRDEVRLWIDAHDKELQESIKTFKDQAAEAERTARAAILKAREAERQIAELQSAVETAKKQVAKSADDFESETRARLQTTLDSTTSLKPSGRELEPHETVAGTLSGLQREALETSEQALREKPESEYTADDWGSRAFSAYASGDLESSAVSFKRAAEAKDASSEQVALAIRNRGTVLGLLGRSAEEIAAYDELIARFKDATEPSVREQVAIGLNNKAAAVWKTDPGEAINVYDQVLDRFTGALEPALREQVAIAINNKGVSLAQTGSSEKAVEAYDELLKRFNDAVEPALREQVVRALFNKGVTLGQLGRTDEAFTVYDDLIGRFGDSTEPTLRRYVAMALISKAETLGRSGKPADALATFDDALKRFSEMSDAKIQNVLVEASFARAVTLSWLAQRPSAIAALQALVDKYASSTNDEVRKFVAKSGDYLANPQSDWKYLDGTWD